MFSRDTPRAFCVKCQVVRTRRHCKRCPWIVCAKCSLIIHPKTLNVIKFSRAGGVHD